MFGRKFWMILAQVLLLADPKRVVEAVLPRLFSSLLQFRLVDSSSGNVGRPPFRELKGQGWKFGGIFFSSRILSFLNLFFKV